MAILPCKTALRGEVRALVLVDCCQRFCSCHMLTLVRNWLRTSYRGCTSVVCACENTQRQTDPARLTVELCPQR